MKRAGPPRRKGKSRRLNVANRHLFHDAARRQLVCAACRARGKFQAHHVIYEQHLRDARLPIYDAQNALRLCPNCHAAHHARRKLITTDRLTRQNVDYAFAVLGVPAYDYFCRYYDNRAKDTRIELALEAAIRELAA